MPAAADSPSIPPSDSPIASGVRQRVARARRRIEDSLPIRVPIETLAREANFSPRHFRRAFRDVVGETVREYERRLILEEAAWLLASWGDSAAAVGSWAGFHSASTFARAFRQQFGVTPTEYARSRPEPEFTAELLPGRVTIERQESFRVAAYRYVGPVSGYEDAWKTVRSLLRPAAWFSPDAVCVGIYRDAWETSPQDYRYDCGVVIGENVERLPDPLVVREVEAGDVAHLTVRGSVAEIELAWRAFAEGWLPRSGYCLRRDYAWDVYPSRLLLGSRLEQVLASLKQHAIRLCLPVEKRERVVIDE